MAISTPCYCTREMVKSALDIKATARDDSQVDRAIEAASRTVESTLKRVFYPLDATRYFDWPNSQRARPWRMWFNQYDCVSLTSVTSGGVSIPLNTVFLEPVNAGPPYTYMEVDISTTSSFSPGQTWQHSLAVVGTWGYSANTASAGALAVAITSTTATTATITDSSQLGVGSVLLIDTERLLVTDRAMVSTGQTQQSGAETATNNDVALTVTDGTKYTVGETLLLDSERMLIVDIAGNVLTVKRAWDGTALATHSSATIYAPRLLTVTRGALGTTAATHLISAGISRYVYPGLVVDLAVAEAINALLQETSGYARTVGEGDSMRLASGAGLADIRAQAISANGRKARQRVV